MAQDSGPFPLDLTLRIVGLASALASALTVQSRTYFFLFVGVTVFALTIPVVRRILSERSATPDTPDGQGASKETRHLPRRSVWVHISSLVVLYAAAAVVVVLFWPRPILEIVTLTFEDYDIVSQWDDAVEGVLNSHADSLGESRDDILARYASGDPQLRLVVSSALADRPPDLKLIGIVLTLRSRRDEPAVLKELLVRVHGATLLAACEEEGQIPVSAAYSVSLCPRPNPTDAVVEYEVPGLRFQLEDARAETLELLLANDPQCTPYPGLALYDIDLELVFDADDRRLRSERFLVAIPTSTYELGQARTGLESTRQFDIGNSCHIWNLDQARSMEDAWNAVTMNSRAADLLSVIKHVETVHPELTRETPS